MLRQWAVLCGMMCLGGCNLSKFTANATSKLFEQAAPAFEQHWDYETAGAAAPANILQLEGLLRASPENKTFLLQLMRAYVGYGYGWVEDAAELAELEGELEKADRQRARARRMYWRARTLGQHLLSLDEDGFDQALAGGLSDFEQWLKEKFEDPEDAVALLWTGYAWGSYINVSRDDMAAVADLSFAKAVVRRSVELDSSYYFGAGLIFLATASTLELGANLDEVKKMWDRALSKSKRRSLLAQVNMAKEYAVRRQDRALYVALLKEVIAAGDPLPEQRLSNRIARRRAIRYLGQVDELF